METYEVVIVMGAVFVLPQVVGYAASRLAKRDSAILWALPAAGTTALLGGISAAYRNQEPDPWPMSLGSFWVGIAAISIFHFAVGSILGVLDQRARTRMQAP